MPFFLDGVAAKADLNQADGIHPTGAGYAVIVGNTWRHIEPLLKR
jgi:acyl-CoA thioesterase-1